MITCNPQNKIKQMDDFLPSISHNLSLLYEAISQHRVYEDYGILILLMLVCSFSFTMGYIGLTINENNIQNITKGTYPPINQNMKEELFPVNTLKLILLYSAPC